MNVDIAVMLIFMLIALIPILLVYRYDRKIEKRLHEVSKTLLEYDVGTLMVSTDGIDEPYIFLGLEIPAEELMRKKRVMLKVHIDDSQKKHTL